jgi:mRNA-degrading endonuclease RelE of RelBE toxin-antitoxin system
MPGARLRTKWLQELYATIKRRLGQFPESRAIAPESDDLGTEVRHLVLDRYRIIFIIRDDTVTVLHVRGPFRDSISDDDTNPLF